VAGIGETSVEDGRQSGNDQENSGDLRACPCSGCGAGRGWLIPGLRPSRNCGPALSPTGAQRRLGSCVP
jgi:hypothetical protein